MNIFFQLFSRVFKKQFAERDAAIRSVGERDEWNRHSAENDRIRLFEFQQWVNTPVIVISNEWQNPIVGFATGIAFITKAKSPILVVWDEISQKEVHVACAIFAFSYQRFDALMKLDPWERCALIYTKHTTDEYSKNKISEVLTKGQIMQRLHVTSFIAKFDAFLQAEQASV